MALHETEREANRAGLQAANTAIMLGLSTAIIGPLTTVVGLKAAITALTLHESELYATVRINKSIDVVEDLGTLDNTIVAAADTTTGLRAAYVTADASITDTLQQGGILWGE